MMNDQKEPGGCCGGKKLDQGAYKKEHAKECCDQNDKNQQTEKSEKGNCCGRKK